MEVFVRGTCCDASGLVMWYAPYSASPHLSLCSPSMLSGKFTPMCNLPLDVQHLGHHDSERVPASVDWPEG